MSHEAPTYFSKPLGPSPSHGRVSKKTAISQKIRYESLPVKHHHESYAHPEHTSAKAALAKDKRLIMAAFIGLCLVCTLVFFYLLGFFMNLANNV